MNPWAFSPNVFLVLITMKGIFTMKYLLMKKIAVASASAGWLLGALAGMGTAAGATTYNFTDLGTLGGSVSGATGINSSGEVVGVAATASGSGHAFTYTTTGGMVDLGTLGGDSSIATGINSSGEVVGEADTASGLLHAFTYTTTGGMVDLGTLSGSNSEANGINDLGVVVGYAGNYAFVYSNGTLTNLNTVTVNLPVGFSLTSAYAINLSGYIVGYGTNAAGLRHAFLLTPIATPEPTSLAMLAVGGVALLIRRRKTV